MPRDTIDATESSILLMTGAEETDETKPAYEKTDIPVRLVFQTILLFLFVLALIIGGLYWIYSGKGTKPPEGSAAATIRLSVSAGD